VDNRTTEQLNNRTFEKFKNKNSKIKNKKIKNKKQKQMKIMKLVQSKNYK